MNEWEKVTVDYTPTNSGSYVVGVYNQSKKYTEDGTFLTSKPSGGWPAGTQIYIDDALLYEVQREETEIERVNVINKTVSDGKITYNVVVPSGSQGYITAASYNADDETLIDTVTMRSSTMPQPLEISIGTAQNGRTEFNLYDSTDSNKKPISLPSTDEWTTDKPSSSITFTLNDDDGRSTALDSVNTYPLYVGDTETDDFTKWSESGHGIDRGSNIRLKTTVESDEYTIDDITWTVSDSTIVLLLSIILI